jgi:hypothetical protein
MHQIQMEPLLVGDRLSGAAGSFAGWHRNTRTGPLYCCARRCGRCTEWRPRVHVLMISRVGGGSHFSVVLLLMPWPSSRTRQPSL